ncbi:hypothetical protein K435DRAFT_879386 [Dendrothele bispora CBS 962.96]|uniref:CCHC-type domain-containing protein n=1 Tax=Dendrothele bispora (strain CBS 962.96) TaxID=1314807 RepID=A0A4S8KL80_DENBC|nr:hypothetical protein K435DRAFT_879386 [Dendrothele bispora CBS 962.96]
MAKDKDEMRVVLTGPGDLENWKFSLQVKAKNRDCWNIISGTILPPSPGDNSNRAKAYWKRNSYAANLIVQSVSQSLFSHIREFPNDPHAIELKARKDPPSEAQSNSTLLKALPDTQDWKDFCRTTRRDIQADDLDFVIREVLREYRQQSRGDKKNDRDGDDDGGNEAMATMGQGKPRGFVAGAPDHTAIFERPHLKCNLCGGVGHYRSQCPSELWTPGTKSANVADEVHMAGLAISGEDYSGPGVAL